MTGSFEDEMKIRKIFSIGEKVRETRRQKIYEEDNELEDEEILK